MARLRITFGQDDGGIASAATNRTDAYAYACNCIGPQPGFPRCPCMMRGLVQRNGRWIEPERDLGPVTALSAMEGHSDG